MVRRGQARGVGERKLGRPSSCPRWLLWTLRRSRLRRHTVVASDGGWHLSKSRAKVSLSDTEDVAGATSSWQWPGRCWPCGTLARASYRNFTLDTCIPTSSTWATQSWVFGAGTGQRSGPARRPFLTTSSSSASTPMVKENYDRLSLGQGPCGRSQRHRVEAPPLP